MSILKTIFGGGDLVKGVFDTIDAVHTSEEEKIIAKSKAHTDLMTAYAPFKVAQRVLAFMFAGTFLLCFSIVLGCTLAGVGKPEDVLEVMRVFWIGEIMLAIIGFYFSGGVVDSFARKDELNKS